MDHDSTFAGSVCTGGVLCNWWRKGAALSAFDGRSARICRARNRRLCDWQFAHDAKSGCDPSCASNGWSAGVDCGRHWNGDRVGLVWDDKVNVAEIKRQMAGLHGFLVNKWHFDELYDALFMKPAHVVGKFCAWFDRAIFDGILHGAAKITVFVAKWDRMFDEKIVDGFVNLLGDSTFAFGRSLKVIQTGRLRQYVMFIVVGVVALFAILFTTFPG